MNEALLCDTAVSNCVSESRFNMWRAVFAMAHADKIVTGEERAFMEGYLAAVPFSAEQKLRLRQDMDDAQDIYALFVGISDPEDRGLFFQFARELCWCDGDYDAQEQEIKDRLKGEHLSRLNLDRLELELHKSRAVFKMKRTAEGRDMHDEAGSMLGLTTFLRRMMSRSDQG